MDFKGWLKEDHIGDCSQKPCSILHLTMRHFVTSLLIFVSLIRVTARNERCCHNHVPGVCTDQANCWSYGGSVIPGLCPGGSDNLCCTVASCNAPRSQGSRCVWVSRFIHILPSRCTQPGCATQISSPNQCGGGTNRTNLCPGPNTFVCCTSGVGSC